MTRFTSAKPGIPSEIDEHLFHETGGRKQGTHLGAQHQQAVGDILNTDDLNAFGFPESTMSDMVPFDIGLSGGFDRKDLLPKVSNRAQIIAGFIQGHVRSIWRIDTDTEREKKWNKQKEALFDDIIIPAIYLDDIYTGIALASFGEYSNYINGERRNDYYAEGNTIIQKLLESGIPLADIIVGIEGKLHSISTAYGDIAKMGLSGETVPGLDASDMLIKKFLHDRNNGVNQGSGEYACPLLSYLYAADCDGAQGDLRKRLLKKFATDTNTDSDYREQLPDQPPSVFFGIFNSPEHESLVTNALWDYMVQNGYDYNEITSGYRHSGSFVRLFENISWAIKNELMKRNSALISEDMNDAQIHHRSGKEGKNGEHVKYFGDDRSSDAFPSHSDVYRQNYIEKLGKEPDYTHYTQFLTNTNYYSQGFRENVLYFPDRAQEAIKVYLTLPYPGANQRDIVGIYQPDEELMVVGTDGELQSEIFTSPLITDPKLQEAIVAGIQEALPLRETGRFDEERLTYFITDPCIPDDFKQRLLTISKS